MGAIWRTKQCFADRDETRALGFDSSEHAIMWNDHCNRTQAEVLARFDKAIEEIKP